MEGTRWSYINDEYCFKQRPISMPCEVFNIYNSSKDKSLEIQYTPCDTGIAAGLSVAPGKLVVCSYAKPYITSGDGNVNRDHDAELKGVGAPSN
ncbi:MAG: hypothetical protein ACKVJK_07845 [Methylophagaceae bacterium]